MCVCVHALCSGDVSTDPLAHTHTHTHTHTQCHVRLKAGLKLREEADRHEMEKGIHLLEEPPCEWECFLYNDVMLFVCL